MENGQPTLIAICNRGLRPDVSRPLDHFRWNNLVAQISLGTHNGVALEKKMLNCLMVV